MGACASFINDVGEEGGRISMTIYCFNFDETFNKFCENCDHIFHVLSLFGVEKLNFSLVDPFFKQSNFETENINKKKKLKSFKKKLMIDLLLMFLRDFFEQFISALK